MKSVIVAIDPNNKADTRLYHTITRGPTAKDGIHPCPLYKEGVPHGVMVWPWRFKTEALSTLGSNYILSQKNRMLLVLSKATLNTLLTGEHHASCRMQIKTGQLQLLLLRRLLGHAKKSELLRNTAVKIMEQGPLQKVFLNACLLPKEAPKKKPLLAKHVPPEESPRKKARQAKNARLVRCTAIPLAALVSIAVTFSGLAVGYGIPLFMAGGAITPAVIAFTVLASLFAIASIPLATRLHVLLSGARKSRQLNGTPTIQQRV